MDYMPWNACLLIKPTLESSSSSSDLAAWVQAVGSVVAIFAAVGVGWWTARQQRKLTREMSWLQHGSNIMESAKTLKEIAAPAVKVLTRISGLLDSREKVFTAAETGLPFDIPELHQLERALDGVELHRLPAQLITPALILSANVRQFRIKVEMALQHYRQMDAAAFDDFFTTLKQMNDSMSKSVSDFAEWAREIDNAVRANFGGWL
jgi:hypothetical protein